MGKQSINYVHAVRIHMDGIERASSKESQYELEY